MSSGKKNTHTWHRLSPETAQAHYCIPQEVVQTPGNVFYTDREDNTAVPDDTAYQIVGLTAQAAPDLVTLYWGNFSLSDLYDLYDFEVVESGDFNFLDVIGGRLNLKKDLGQSLITILETYLQSMPDSSSFHDMTFTPLTSTDLAYYQLKSYPQYKQEVYKLETHPATNQDTISLLVLSVAVDRPTFLSTGITQFSLRAFQSNPKFNVFIHGQGHITLTRSALLALTSLLKEKVDSLILLS